MLGSCVCSGLAEEWCSAAEAAKVCAGRARRLAAAVGPGGADSPALLGLVAPARNSLHSLRSCHSDTRAESEVEAREYARGPQALRCSPCRPHQAQAPGRAPGTNSPPDCLCPGSPQQMRATPCPHSPLRNRWLFSEKEPRLGRRCFSSENHLGARKAVGGRAAGRICGAEERRRGVGARTRALRYLTREHCPSETSAASEASCERDPHPSTAGESAPQGRPPQLSPKALPPVASPARAFRRRCLGSAFEPTCPTR